MLKYIVFLLTVFSVLNILPVSGFLSSDVKQIRREAIAPDNDFQINPEKIKNGLPGATESRRGILKVPDLKCPIGSRLDALGNCRKRFP